MYYLKYNELCWEIIALCEVNNYTKISIKKLEYFSNEHYQNFKLNVSKTFCRSQFAIVQPITNGGAA